MKYFKVLLLSISLVYSCTSKEEVLDNETLIASKRVVAYVNGLEDNWGEEFEKAKQITHINYAFANIEKGHVIAGGEKDADNLIKLNALKQVNPKLKILISVGGWSWSKNFSDAALTKDSREIFANSTIAFMQKYQIDGIDLDWEYPGQVGDGNVYRSEDKENFTAILKLLREKLDALSIDQNSYLLTIATGANQQYLDFTDMQEAHKYLDFINIMTYDFHGGWEQKTGHHANLTVSTYDDSEDARSAASSVQQHIDAGIPLNKIVLGVPFYGIWLPI